MGYGCGFDIYPALEPTPSNQDKYEHFIQEIMRTYSASDADPDSDADSDSRPAELVAKPRGAILEFMVGEHPSMPYNPRLCHYFLRFSSKVSGGLTARAEPFIRGVHRIAKRRFGDRVMWWHEMSEGGTKAQQYGMYDYGEVDRVQLKLESVLRGDVVDDGDNGLVEKKGEMGKLAGSVGGVSAGTGLKGSEKE
jgi:hypothetical protein